MFRIIVGSVLLILASANLGFAQIKEDPMAVWQEYLNMEPDLQEIANLLDIGAPEPFRSWIISKLVNDLAGDSGSWSRHHLRHLLDYESQEDYSDQIWQILTHELDLEDLGTILICGTYKNQRRAFDILSKMSLTNIELANLMSGVQESTYKEQRLEEFYPKLLQRFMSQAPTNEDLFFLRIGYYHQFALSELFKRPLSNDELFKIARYYRGINEDGSNSYPGADKALAKIDLYSLKNEQLEFISNSVRIEPYTQIAKQILENRNSEQTKERKKELMGIITKGKYNSYYKD